MEEVEDKLPKHFKLALALAIILAAAIIGYGSWEQSKYEGNAKNQAGENAWHANKDVDHCAVSETALDKRNCTIEARRKQRDYERDEQDLQAQKTSALWTFLMGSAAIVGMMLSAVGVWLVYTTFGETRKTARAAVRANEIAQETAFKQLRPYLCYDVVQAQKYTKDDGEISFVAFTIIWKNMGQTPAKIISLASDFVPLEKNGALPNIVDGKRMGAAVMGPGNVVWAESFTVFKDNLVAAKETGKRMILWSKVTYTAIDDPKPEWSTETGVEIIITVKKVDKSVDGMFRFKAIDQYSRMT